MIICDNLVVQFEKSREKLEYICDLFKGVFTDEHDYSMKSALNNISNVYSNDVDGKLYYDKLLHLCEYHGTRPILSTTGSSYKCDVLFATPRNNMVIFFKDRKLTN